MYPYGDRYDPNRCVTENERVMKAGQKRKCSNAGVSDMVGNAWEWVEEKHNDYVRAFGGSYRYGKDAHCTLKFEGTVATRSNETGFRCCK
jgi:formylglycine-generating enzyme required for sulfatase activity